MGIIEKLKSDRLAYRREKEVDKVSFINFILSAIEFVGKNAGNRETTNDEAITVLKKMVNNMETTINLINEKESVVGLVVELEYVKSLLPQMLSVEYTTEVIKTLFAENNNKGSIMKSVKTMYGPLIDMRLVGNIIDELSKGV